MPATSSRAVRPWLIVTLALVVLGGAGGLVALGVFGKKGPDTSASTPPDTREERARAAFLVAPGPSPVSLPLLGPEGTDADGYPTRYVDRAGLRSLLHVRKFEALDRYFAELQAAFEADPRKEYWPIDAGEAFASAEPELAMDLDAWVAASPNSFAPYYARGCHRVGVMWAMRGQKYVSNTPQEDLQAMEAAGASAVADLNAALQRRPRLVAAMRQEMQVAMTGSGSRLREEMLRRATEACPACLQYRATYLRSRTPRWGGSYDAMRAFVAGFPLAANPRLRVLAGYEDLDRAESLALQKMYDDALLAIERATKLGDYWEYLLERANVLDSQKRSSDALADLNRADALRPMHPQILAERARIERIGSQFLAAGRDLLTTLRIDPANVEGKRLLPFVLEGVSFQAQQLEKAGKHPEALDAADLALALAPVDGKVHGLHAWIVLGDATTPERIEALRRRVRDQPGDYRAVQQLDYALSRQNAFPEILSMWNKYIELHPDEGRAYIERAGTYVHLGRSAEARADAVRACDLGISEGCERAK